MSAVEEEAGQVETNENSVRRDVSFRTVGRSKLGTLTLMAARRGIFFFIFFLYCESAVRVAVLPCVCVFDHVCVYIPAFYTRLFTYETCSSLIKKNNSVNDLDL